MLLISLTNDTTTTTTTTTTPSFEQMGNADLGYLDPVTGEPFPDGAYYTDGPSKRRGGAVSA